MYRLSSIAILFLCLHSFLLAQNPHGEAFKIDCASCHTPDGWEVDYKLVTFEHDSTRFQLEGQHDVVDCKMCHETPVFAQAEMECASCHLDVHSQTAGMDCARCHTSESWLVDNITEIHEEINFPLLGAHAVTSCFDCHQAEDDLRFDLNGIDCINCHRDDYTATINPSHIGANYSTNCTECHKMDAFEWSTTSINHDFFPLEKGHDIANCSSCHISDDYSSTSPDCVSCHMADYESATNPNHVSADLSTDCTSCHTTEPDWKPAEFQEHDELFFPIYNGSHADEWNSCAECHTSLDNYVEFTCISCHEHNDVDMDDEHSDVNGYSYNSTACLACHPNGESDGVFDHNKTNFPLTGEHLVTECISCHSDGYTGTSTVCADCHTMDFNGSVNPNHADLGLTMDCAACHTTDPDWNPAQFPDHNDFYALNGAHIGIANDCASCHNGDYNNTPTTCAGCHQEEYEGTTDPNHVESQFSTNCAVCHTEDVWVPSTFDHDATDFPLTGEHLQTDCISCHADGYEGTSTICADCHTMDFNETENPNHADLGLSMDCASCHTTDPEWNPALFPEHSDFYALNGAHAVIANDCATCHNGDYNNTPNTCAGCHQNEYDQTSNPNHLEAQFSTDCATCHSEIAWEPATFDHDMSFPIYSGKHEGEWNECAQCHTNPADYSEFSCLECHLQGEMDPEHEGVNGYTYSSGACYACHPTGDGSDGFNHDLTNFPLTGVHIETDCISCHAEGYAGTSTICADCHTLNFNEATNPNHVELGLPTDCASCHTTDPDWNPALFPDHNDFYALNGAHAGIANDCATCHNGDYSNTPNTCAGCHQADYDGTTDPNHMESQFSTDCISCHTEDAWVPSTFDHNETAFPLTGEHLQTDCISCHTVGYAGTTTVCVDCHTANFNEATNPNHVELGLPSDCASCHTTDPDWNPALFPDHNDFYALNGAHAGIANDCATCHNGDYNNTPNTCAGCHQNEYDQTSDPNHTSAQFSTDCLTCHTEDAWEPSTFDHDGMYFPIYSGEHEGEWNACTQCHINTADYSEFSCLECHELGETEQVHAGVNGYTYNSDACFACHPTGDGSDGFNHNETNFALTGVHAVTDCIDCHSAGFEGTSTVCADCHTIDFNEAANPNHTELGLPTDCASCHTTNPDWNPALFPDHNNFYALNGAHAGIANDCATCHNGDYTNTPNTCAGCHQADYDGTTDPNHVESQFSTDCIICHTEDAWEPSTFDHNETAFPLTGEHLQADCISCHTDGYAGTSTICANCHTTNFNETTNPNHTELGLPTDCVSCHTTDPDWNPALFPDHNDFYALNGAHAGIGNDCATCHNGDYNNTPNTCAGCHQADYDGTTDPNHVESQFSTDCISCHTEDAWEPSTFDHNETAFPLTGEHLQTDCISCHTDGYAGTSTICADCHTTNFNETTNPNHTELGLPTDCASCHTIDPDWNPALFPDHNDFYTLNGAHAGIENDCATCHNGDYNNTPNTCAGCHQENYNQTTNPDHIDAQFSTDCISCHSEDAWQPATFDHQSTDFPLNGAHFQVDCISCHTDGYSGTSTLCVDCHLADFNQTNNPDHQSAQFPTDCASCHTENAWEPSTFDHDEMYFPIFSGKHDGEWNLCMDCHMVPNDYSIFSCLGCHGQGQTDDVHSEVNGYTYESNACLSCHPDGEN